MLQFQPNPDRKFRPAKKNTLLAGNYITATHTDT
jgi:hypothetical protein